MARKPTILTDLSKYSAGNAIVQYKNAGNGLRANPNFLTPDIAMVAYDAAAEDYEIKVADKPKTPPKTAALKVARNLINYNYKINGNYVIRICNGDEVKLKTSNYLMGSDGEPRVNAIFTAENGINPGDVDFSCKADPAASSYLIFFRIVSETTPNEWAFCKVLGSHKGSKSGFLSGLEYEFKMMVIYSTTEGAFCDPVILRML
jgi:hypothetical protein